MTDPKGRSLKECSEQRKLRYRAVSAAKKVGKTPDDIKTVHHKDGNRKNNSPTNLEIVNLKKHSAMHGRGHKKPTKG